MNTNRYLYKILIILMLSLMVLTGCKKKPVNEQKVAKISDTSLYMDEMMYHIYVCEYEGAQTEAFYQSYFGMSYWDQEFEDGITMKDQAKTDTMDTLIRTHILYKEALENGYEITEEMKSEDEEYAKGLWKEFNDEQKEISGLTLERLTEIVHKVSLADLYSNDIIEGFDINEESIKNNIKKADYKQYNTQAIFISTEGYYDENDNETPLSAEEKKAAYDKIASILEAAKSGKDFKELVSEDDEEMYVENFDFVVGEEYMEPEFEKAAMGLSVDGVSDIVETEYGYYIIKLLNNDSDEAYLTAVDEAVELERQNQFNEFYEGIKKKYKVKVYDKMWKPIVMGKTLVLYSPDEALEEGVMTE